mgnify:CR=1 FL=1
MFIGGATVIFDFKCYLSAKGPAIGFCRLHAVFYVDLRDERGKFYPLYTWAALLYFVSDMWLEA